MSDEAVSGTPAAGGEGEKPRLFNRTFNIILISAIFVLGVVLYVRKEFKPVLLKSLDVSEQSLRNSLLQLADESRELTAQGKTLREALVELGGKLVMQQNLSEYSLYVTPEVALHGEKSKMPRDEKLEWWQEVAPTPWVDEEAHTFNVVLAKRTRGFSKAEAWSVDSQRTLTRGIYKFK